MKRWLKRLGIGVLALVIVIGAAGAGLYGVTASRFRKSYDVKVEKIAVPADAEAVARGKRFATVIAKCVDCHGANLQGKLLVDDPKFARLAASNLTAGKGGVATRYQTDEDWVRAIRHGVRPDGKALIFMPSNEYWHLNDQDLGDIIAYLEALAPVDNELPTAVMGPIARGLYAAKKLPLLTAEIIDHDAARPAPVTPGPTAEYGKYIARVGGCHGCHKENLAGGRDMAAPPEFAWPANLTPAGRLGKWGEADFFRAMREGKRPDGSNIDPFMPWALTAQMNDDEIRAIWNYLKTVPAVGGIVVKPEKS